MLPEALAVLASSHGGNGLRGLWLALHIVGQVLWFGILVFLPVHETLALRSEDLARARRALKWNYRLETWGMVPALLLITLSGALLLFQSHEEQPDFFIVELLVTMGVLVVVSLVVIPATRSMWQAAEEADDFEDARETLVRERLKELAFGFIPVIGTVYLLVVRTLV